MSHVKHNIVSPVTPHYVHVPCSLSIGTSPPTYPYPYLYPATSPPTHIPTQEQNLNTQCYQSATPTAALVSFLVQVNTADPVPSRGSNGYLLAGADSGGYGLTATCQAAMNAIPTGASGSVGTTAAGLPAYRSACVPLVSESTGVGVAGYYLQVSLSASSQVPSNGYVAALTYQVSG